jgi:hypothetical protein
MDHLPVRTRRFAVTVLLASESARPGQRDGDLFTSILEHMEARWPGTLVVAASRQPPADLDPSTRIDWLRLPDPGDEVTAPLASELLASTAAMHRTSVSIFVGRSALALLDGAQPPWFGHRIFVAGAEPAPAGAEVERVLELSEPGGVHALLETLDDELAPRVPMGLLVDAGTELSQVIEQLHARPAWRRMPGLTLFWEGPAVDALPRLVRGLSETVDLPITVEAGLRSALAPRASSFLATGWASLRAASSLTALPPTADLQLRVEGPGPWLQLAAGGADHALRLLRRLRRPSTGGAS